MNRPASLIALTFVCVSCLAGCGAKQRGHSGFLADYSKLEPSPRIADAKVYRDAQTDFGKYKRFMIDPIGVHFAPDATGAAVDPKTLNDMASYFQSKLNEGLSKNYQVVSAAGPDVLRLRIALTDLQKANPMMNIHPATKLSGVGLGSASVEAEGLDSASGKRVFAFVHTRTGDRLAIAEGLESWGHAKQAIDYWVEQLVARIDEAHGKPAK